MIEIKNLQKKFGKLQVLKQVNASFVVGKSYAVIGPNGSGKTTFIKCVLGMVIPDSGIIEVNEQSIFNQWDYRNQIGYMPQIGRYPDTMKIGQLFEMMRDLRSQVKEIDEELIQEFGLTKLFDKRMHTLSGGTRQKVSAALAFLFAPPILILDEPTAGLDPLAVEILKAKIQKERTNQKLFLITSHILSDLDELTSDVIYLDDGSVLFNDTIAELKDVTGEIRLGAAIATIMKRNLTHAVV